MHTAVAWVLVDRLDAYGEGAGVGTKTFHDNVVRARLLALPLNVRVHSPSGALVIIIFGKNGLAVNGHKLHHGVKQRAGLCVNLVHSARLGSELKRLLRSF
jgi:hypothetical protein